MINKSDNKTNRRIDKKTNNLSTCQLQTRQQNKTNNLLTRQLRTCQLKKNTSGGYCGGVPPLPIPNREVKPTCADGTAMQCGRVGSRLLLQSTLKIHFFRVLFCLYTLRVCDFRAWRKLFPEWFGVSALGKSRFPNGLKLSLYAETFVRSWAVCCSLSLIPYIFCIIMASIYLVEDFLWHG